MKILILSSLAFSLVNFRGALLERLQLQGHEILASAPDSDEGVIAWLHARGMRFAPVPMNRTGRRIHEDIRTLFAYLRLIAREKPDLVIAYTQKPIIYGGIAARLSGDIPFFALMSGLGYLFSPDGSRPGPARSIFIRLYKAGVARARKIFVFNRDDRADMLAAGIITSRHKVVQVPGSGVDTAHFAFAPVPPTPPRFLMVGRLMRDKGVYEYLEAARQLTAEFPDARFDIVGRAEPLNPTGISDSEVSKLQREYPVRFLGETRDVRPFLAEASVFVLPSFYREGLPRTILEAMATGRAVVTTDLPGCRDPVENGVNGFLVPPRDASALAAAMRRFILEPDLMTSMGLHSRIKAERIYDVERVNAMLIDEIGLNHRGEGVAAPRPARTSPSLLADRS